MKVEEDATGVLFLPLRFVVVLVAVLIRSGSGPGIIIGFVV